MRKMVLLATVATMMCVTLAGCGKNDSKPKNVETTPEVITTEATTEDEYIPVVESVADAFNVDLADNQYIITANDKNEMAIILTAPEGYQFEDSHSFNNTRLVNKDGSESYLIYDGTGTLTEESLTEMNDVEDMGDGCYIEKGDAIRAYCFKDGASVIITYNNADDSNPDVEKVVTSIKSVVEGFEICK